MVFTKKLLVPTEDLDVKEDQRYVFGSGPVALESGPVSGVGESRRDLGENRGIRCGRCWSW